MQEHTVSAAGKSMKLPSPFFVLATQNPIEMEGTYILPEAQIDRFMFRIDVPYPRIDTLTEILRMTTGEAMPRARGLLHPEDILSLQRFVRSVPAAEHVRRAVATLAASTQPDQADAQTRRHIQFGLSPRGSQSMILAAKANALMAGRFNVAREDLEAVLLPIVRHRIHLTYQAEAEGVTVDDVAKSLFDRHIRSAL
jgi:MoxR-like ATPase